jgi:hypothetical protein
MNDADKAILLQTSIEMEAMGFAEVVDDGFESNDVLPLLDDQKQLLIIAATHFIAHLITHGIKIQGQEQGPPPVQ